MAPRGSNSLEVLAGLAPQVPARLAERAEQWVPGTAPATPRRSASVVLLREGAGGLETYLLHRHARMTFATSMVVFPGGGLEPVDETGVDPLRSCACRETAEETGVVLRPDDLLPWAHWVTPELEPRRYDTFFYLATLPAGAEALDISGETDRAGWMTPSAALAAERAGQIALMPPTLSIVTELADAGTIDALRERARDRVIETVLPRLVRAEDGWRFDYPRPGAGPATVVRLVRAPNPGPMTLQGTNTWVLGDPALGPCVVVDPGPLIESHLDQVLAAAGGRIATIVLTHRHLDHSESADALAERSGCGVRAADPTLQRGPAGLVDGDVISAAGIRLEVLATPGHTSDSTSLLLTSDDGAARLLTGDMVLGQGTTVITHPDGDLGRYFTSLIRMQQVVAARQVAEILPGHGPVVPDPAGTLAFYRRHREDRLDQVRAALAAGDQTPAAVVARVYADVDRSVWPAAEQSVRAQLDYLRDAAGP